MQYVWTTYSVFDLDATIAFYHDLLGLKVVPLLSGLLG